MIDHASRAAGNPRVVERGHGGRFIGGGGEQDVQRIASGAGIGLAFLAEHLRELLVHVPVHGRVARRTPPSSRSPCPPPTRARPASSSGSMCS